MSDRQKGKQIRRLFRIGLEYRGELPEELRRLREMGEGFRRQRQELGISQSQIAEEVNVHVDDVDQYERGVLLPEDYEPDNLDELLKLALDALEGV